ncbi:saccharopine dehydrogenase NADP-binding domain-containing protein [Streptomyces sp. NBC_01288]|uniref:saccharopine dehydrogenase family protein n=1 Tax=Streptomyces sp. NBC_01288 TaxID=2903814 RepID=UPI002E0F31D0|nr:saccharopine dehydrogenase NADP-binding domain-containing protein [Streptomyces sp. NBC_01288]
MTTDHRTHPSATPATPLHVTVIGAYGHTGRFVVAELRRRGLIPILSGRDPQRLAVLGELYPDLETRPATVDDPASLDRALAGAAAVINCAGPFASTAAPVIDAALRAGVPYLDVTAETEVVLDTIAAYGDRAREAGGLVVPAVAFYGGLGDLLATAAVGDWKTVDGDKGGHGQGQGQGHGHGHGHADRISIAYALSDWRPTDGTRVTGQVSAGRRSGGRILYADGRLQSRSGDAPRADWMFPDPIGTQPVVGEFTMADSATIPTHLSVPDIDTCMTVSAVADLRSADTSGPVAVDDSGRSAQTFLVEVVARRDGQTRRAVAAGQDIYAVTAPLVVEATCRVLADPHRPSGVVTAGALADARGFLGALAPGHLTLDFTN